MRNKFDIDETLEAEFNLGHAKRLSHYLGKHKKTVAITSFLMLLSGVLNIIAPLIQRNVLDVQLAARNWLMMLFLGACTVAVYLCNGIIAGYRVKSTTQLGQNIIEEIRRDLFAHLQKLSLSYYDSRPHGKILVRVVNYVNALNDLLSSGIINTITELVSLVAIIAVMFWLNAHLALIGVAGIVIFSVILMAMKTRISRAWRVHSAKKSNLNAYIHESIAGVRVTQSFAREEQNEKIFREQSEAVAKTFFIGRRYEQAVAPTVEMLAVICNSAILVLGALMLPSGGITLGTLISFTVYVGMFWQPIINLCNVYNSLTNGMAYLERIFETMDQPIEIDDAPDALVMPPISGNVRFENVVFAYEKGGAKILDGASFEVKPGERVALVGPTGAGKSTIISLISRFYDASEGKVLIDGQDVSTVTLKSLRSQLGIMLQDTFIFAGTVMDNIRYGRLDATDREVVEAAKAVCAHEFISEMERGYETEVNERGSRLSAGQRQLISFARTLLSNPRILILDEATSSIDSRTEMALQKGLEVLLGGRTSFIIAHRLSTIKNCDTIMYISNGGILEKGSHDQLVSMGGKYKELYNSQYDNSIN